ncbi:MAG TPA: hypothetical protein ENN40_02000 [Candidatus Aminicenantes bacterium]|nr:hypothetical protein [Candidatus Aminicenantes bacterium]
MILFWTDPAAPGGWPRLERSVNLGVHAAPRRHLVVAAPRSRRVEKYLAARRVPAVWHEQVLRDFPEVVRLTIVDVGQYNQPFLRMVAMCGEREIPVIPIRDPGDPAFEWKEGCLGGWPPGGDSQSPPGPAWAILHPRFRHVNRARRTYSRRVRKILLNLEDRLGYRELRDLIDCLWRLGYRLRIGPTFLVRDNLKRALSRKYPGIRWVGAVECMARPLFEADAAIVAPGAAALEAAAAGTPAFYFSRNAGERDIAVQLQALGMGMVLTSFKEPLESPNRDTLRQWGENGRKLVDGRGLFRTLEYLRDQGHLSHALNGAAS